MIYHGQQTETVYAIMPDSTHHMPQWQAKAGNNGVDREAFRDARLLPLRRGSAVPTLSSPAHPHHPTSCLRRTPQVGLGSVRLRHGQMTACCATVLHHKRSPAVCKAYLQAKFNDDFPKMHGTYRVYGLIAFSGLHGTLYIR